MTSTIVDRQDPSTVSPNGSRPTHPHRLHLDGLRAVAVYLVVAFHAGVGRFAGGFIGVDLFFVLSGYLVTQVLLRDVAERGSVDLSRFYARRFRRLLPASAVVLVVTAAVFVEVGTPAEWDAALDGIRAAALYVANWFFISQSADYFAADIESNPVMHFWSLAVEEQFYLLWPLLLIGLMRVTRGLANPRRGLQILVAVGAATSLGAAILISREDLTRAYYGTDTRAYQLLFGALIALAPGMLDRLRPRMTVLASSVATIGGLGALIVLSTHLVDVDAVQRGLLAALVSVVLIVTLDTSSGGFGQRLLSIPPVVYLGRISYGTYLWHWLVVVVVTRELDLGTPTRLVVVAVVSSAMAALSYELIEQPIRTYRALDRHRGPVIAVGLAMSLLVALVVAPRVLTGEVAPDEAFVARSESAEVNDVTAATPDWQEAHDDIADLPDCLAANTDGCRLVEGSGAQVLLLGDSHARMLIPAFEDLAEQMDLSLAAGVTPACPWMNGVLYASSKAVCAESQEAWYGPVFDAVDPDLVVVAHRAVDDPASPVPIHGEGTSWLESGTEEFDALLRDRISSTVDDLRGRGARVLIIEPIPLAREDEDPLACLSEGDGAEACRFLANMEPLGEEIISREVAAGDPGVWSLDLDQATCPYLPICDPIVDGLIVRRDDTHLTTRFARTLVDGLERYLLDNRIVT